MTTMRRVSFAGLCVVPFVVFTAAAARPLRVPALYQAVGVAACLPIVVASRVLRLQAIRSTSPLAQQLALAGELLLVPFTVMALLWIGIGCWPALWSAFPRYRG